VLLLLLMMMTILVLKVAVQMLLVKLLMLLTLMSMLMLTLMLMLVLMLLQAAVRCFKKLEDARDRFERERKDFEDRMQTSGLLASWPKEVLQNLVVVALDLCKVSQVGQQWLCQGCLRPPAKAFTC
jgi:high-affinity nickel permease